MQNELVNESNTLNNPDGGNTYIRPDIVNFNFNCNINNNFVGGKEDKTVTRKESVSSEDRDVFTEDIEAPIVAQQKIKRKTEKVAKKVLKILTIE
jgi:hypothetical protein